MIFQLKITSFDLNSFKELFTKLCLIKNRLKVFSFNSVILPTKKKKRTILRAPNGDKKTGQDCLELGIYISIIQFSFFDLKTFLSLFKHIIKNCGKIEFQCLRNNLS